MPSILYTASQTTTLPRHGRDHDMKPRKVVTILCVAFAIVGVAWFICASGYWDVRDIQVSEVSTLEKGDVIREVQNAINARPYWRPWKPMNLLFIEPNDFQKQLEERLFVDSIIVEKDYPNILRLIVRERQRSVILVANDRMVSVDASGVVTTDAKPDVVEYVRGVIGGTRAADASHVPIIHTTTDDPLTSGFEVTSSSTVRTWLNAYRMLQERHLNVDYARLESPTARIMRFVDPRRIEIYFDLDEALEPQINTYAAYVQSHKKDPEPTSYIDVRVPGKIFVK